ncbi:hypothetical protein CDAR_76652 [Caerostris darwini]|uniref:Uncharacterized protein n=1 Tax=Caerostris darwini TaxID=1538125 RepID=A0AAV4QHL0_9ARAC|nr:hypothetical protein CDAR_76652 [Caerostris darwini]
MPSHFKRQEPLFPRKLLVTSQKVIVGADDRWAQDRGRSSDKSSRWDYRTGRSLPKNIGNHHFLLKSAGLKGGKESNETVIRTAFSALKPVCAAHGGKEARCEKRPRFSRCHDCPFLGLPNSERPERAVGEAISLCEKEALVKGGRHSLAGKELFPQTPSFGIVFLRSTLHAKTLSNRGKIELTCSESDTTKEF